MPSRVALPPARGDLTIYIKEQLEARDILVGLIDAPREGGWDDDPGPDSSYVDYTVLTPMQAGSPQGSVGMSESEWTLPYSFAYYGINHAQVEGQADSVRKMVHEIDRGPVSLGGVNWKIMSVVTSSIGGIDIARQAEPNEFSQRDVLMIRISKEI